MACRLNVCGSTTRMKTQKRLVPDVRDTWTRVAQGIAKRRTMAIVNFVLVVFVAAALVRHDSSTATLH